MKSVFESSSPDQTKEFAEEFAKVLKGGEIIEIIGDVGSGKTTFVTYLSQALGSQDKVTSPTFKICNSYRCQDFVLHHCDFYRLGKDDGLIKNELAELVGPGEVVALEWSEVLDLDLGTTIKIKISVLGEASRRFEVIE